MAVADDLGRSDMEEPPSEDFGRQPPQDMAAEQSVLGGMLLSKDAIAEGMLAAVKRLYLLGKNDRPTGTFTFAELLAHELSVERTGQLGGS